MKQIEVNPYKIDFFKTTIQLFQRGDIKQQQELINVIFKNKTKTKEEITLLLEENIDNKVIDSFFEEMNVDNKSIDIKLQNEVVNEFLESYFFEEKRYDKYIKDIVESKEQYEKVVNTFFDMKEELKTSEELKTFIKSKTSEFKKVINNNAKAKNRKKFSLDKSNKELISRSKKIYNTLNTLKLEDKYFKKDYEKLMQKLSKNILTSYSLNNRLSYLNEYEQIEKLSSDIQLISQVFNNLKNDFYGSDVNIKEKIEKENGANINFEGFNSLQGKGSTAGNDFYVRTREKIKSIIFPDEVGSKTKSKRSVVQRDKKIVEEVKIDKTFKSEFRELISYVLKLSEIDFNASSNSLFINPVEFGYLSFGLDKEKVDSFVNINLNASDSNPEILLSMINLKNIDENNIYSIVNKKPQEKLFELKREKSEIKSDDNLSEIKKETETGKINKKISEIEKLSILYKNFKNKYGNFIEEKIEDEILNEINYSVNANKKYEKYNNSDSSVNIKEEFSKNDNKMFLDLEDLESLIDLIINLKEVNSEPYMKNKIGDRYHNSIIGDIMEISSNFKISKLSKYEKSDIEKILEMKNKVLSDIKEEKNRQLRMEGNDNQLSSYFS